jgi:thiamine-monophosphate kinase
VIVPFSERAFHRWLSTHLRGSRNDPLPLGDDAAGITPGRGVLLLTTDSLIEGSHFLRGSPARRIGSAAVAVSLSDIAAKGGRPAGVLLDLLLPASTPMRWAQEVVLGAEHLATRYGCHVVGGDTKPSPVRTVVGTVVGFGSRSTLSPRSGARVGDLLVTTGPVGRGGWAARSLRVPGNPKRAVLTELLRVTPRVREGPILSRYAHAMMDTSDGIAESAHLMAAASHRRVILETERLPLYPPITKRIRNEGERLSLAFFGGDYELLAAVPPARVPAARRQLSRVPCTLTVVGRVVRGRGAVLEQKGTPGPLPHSGWQPFDRVRSPTL